MAGIAVAATVGGGSDNGCGRGILVVVAVVVETMVVVMVGRVVVICLSSQISLPA